MYEHRDQRLLPRHRFVRRLVAHWTMALALIAGALGIGIAGYMGIEHMPWDDALLNASMLLGGMGPVKTDLSEPGKIFAGLYALYAGLVVIAVAGILLGPGVHHLMHHVDWDEPPEDE